MFRLSWLLIPATILTIVGIVTSQTRLAILVAVVAFLTLLAPWPDGACHHDRGRAGRVPPSFRAMRRKRYSTIAPSKVVHTAITARQGSLAIIPTYVADYPLGAGIVGRSARHQMRLEAPRSPKTSMVRLSRRSCSSRQVSRACWSCSRSR